jgi:glycolate oxidase iron-sulfur subunit
MSQLAPPSVMPPSVTLPADAPCQGMGFDGFNPPDATLIDACVHCGFCLSTCPSYRVLGTEMDSPRGRIYLMDGINAGEVPFSPAAVSHFDSCLGCLACVTTCPSGVQYDKLIESTRAQVNRNYDRPPIEKLVRQLIFNLFPYPDRLRILMRPLTLYQTVGLQDWVRSMGFLKLISPQLAAMEGMLPKLSPAAFQDVLPESTLPVGETRYRVGMLLGCVQRLFNPAVNAATMRVLAANGCEVVIPKVQGCCGALSHHQGEEESARSFARQMIDTFEASDVEYVLVNASGCGHTMKEYGHLLQDDREYADRAIAFVKKVRDVQEFLVEVGFTAPLSPLQMDPLSLVYQDACHMIHGQKITAQPRKLLRSIPGVKLKEPIDAALCCGSAGVYNILQPEVAAELGRQKVTNLTQTGASAIASANIGCYVQISKHLQLQGKAVPVLHPMQYLDFSIRGLTLVDGLAELDRLA